MRTITLAITTFQRYEYLIDCFHQVLDDPRISEIVIVDDASDKLLFDKIKTFCDPYPKIKLHRNLSNQDCYRNKMTSVAYSSNPWCVIFDSDNVIDKKYLDNIYKYEFWEPDTVYQPVFAQPQFDFRAYSDMLITKDNVHAYMGLPMFTTALNAMNYFVNRDEYLRVWDGNVNPHTSDSIFQNYNWLKGGNRIKFVPDLEYYHRVHSGSHYQNNNHLGGNVYQIIENRLKAMR
jgi:glycosyltransferase involved in cell wall biosynthesis